MSDNPFGPDVIAAVARHMNDGTGVDFAVTVDGAERTVRVPFGRPLTEG